MAICEFLHCSYSEMRSRCPNLYDRLMIIQYIREKNDREKRAMPPLPNTPQAPSSRVKKR
jgi:hypothetical protein